jgi:hypothetical protein
MPVPVCNLIPRGLITSVRTNTALLTDAFHSALRAAPGAAKRER